ncbi:MAG TPA: GTPase, partial [Candidatus Eisenbacteria bacterium]|nr:GTPase [Candidatus Eisenbacteria bacterium]
MLLPIVAIVGRPNVGKSTLFNRILGQRRAIVDELPGLTRDRHYAEGDWSGRKFLLVDTGGIDPQSPHPIQRQIMAQTTYALEEADVTLLVMDAREGMTPLDRDVAERVRRAGRPTLLVINKVDHKGNEEALAEFYALGVGEPM